VLGYRQHAHLSKLAEQEAIKPVIAERMKLAQAREAHAMLGRSDVQGKIMLLG
jgi:NADPH:quinone reductase-like Zn-dependent oxidoreductase